LRRQPDQSDNDIKEDESEDDQGGGPMFKSIHRKLALLQPTSLVVVDESHKHAGHTGTLWLHAHACTIPSST